MQLQQILDFINTPLGAGLLIAVSVLFPQAAKGIDFIKSLLKKQPLAPSPANPAGPSAEPTAPVGPSLIESSMQLLKALALKRFPWLSPERAIHQFAAECLSEGEKRDAEKALAAVKAAAEKA